jgi:hypothetical protein
MQDPVCEFPRITLLGNTANSTNLYQVFVKESPLAEKIGHLAHVLSYLSNYSGASELAKKRGRKGLWRNTPLTL